MPSTAKVEINITANRVMEIAFLEIFIFYSSFYSTSRFIVNAEIDSPRFCIDNENMVNFI